MPRVIQLVSSEAGSEPTCLSLEPILNSMSASYPFGFQGLHLREYSPSLADVALVKKHSSIPCCGPQKAAADQWWMRWIPGWFSSRLKNCQPVCEITQWTGMQIWGVRRLLVHSPGCVAQGLGSILGSLQDTHPSQPPSSQGKLIPGRKFPQQQFPAGGRRASSALTEFPGKLYREEGKIEKYWDVKTVCWWRKEAVNSVCGNGHNEKSEG